jgi:hypothetical protein
VATDSDILDAYWDAISRGCTPYDARLIAAAKYTTSPGAVAVVVRQAEIRAVKHQL